jgi:hypothetical protein
MGTSYQIDVVRMKEMVEGWSVALSLLRRDCQKYASEMLVEPVDTVAF